MFNTTPIVKKLLIINMSVFLLQTFTAIDFMQLFSLRYYQSEYFRFYQVLTHTFLHADLEHLFCNMLSLNMFGPAIEQLIGKKKFILFYISMALGSVCLHMAIQKVKLNNFHKKYSAYVYDHTTPDKFAEIISQDNGFDKVQLDAFIKKYFGDPYNPHFIDYSKKIIHTMYYHKMNQPSVGASGVIFGIMTAFAMIFPETNFYMIIPIPIKAKYFIIIYGIYELYKGVHESPLNNIGHFAHLGGIVFGYLFVRLFRKFFLYSP